MHSVESPRHIRLAYGLVYTSEPRLDFGANLLESDVDCISILDYRCLDQTSIHC
jgi:hypothetical protein